MRRLFATLSALSLLAIGVGCNHTCGVCDCDPAGYSCGCTCPGMGYKAHHEAMPIAPVAGMPMAAPAALPPAEMIKPAPEVIKVAPKPEGEAEKEKLPKGKVEEE